MMVTRCEAGCALSASTPPFLPGRFAVVVLQPRSRSGPSVLKLRTRADGAESSVSFDRVRFRGEARARRDTKWIELAVADTGIGMTLEQQARLFEEFPQSTGRPHSASAVRVSASPSPASSRA